MVGAPTLEEARQWFAEELRAIGHLTDERVVGAFAAIPRERFAGPGPWNLFHITDGYWSTPDNDPAITRRGTVKSRRRMTLSRR